LRATNNWKASRDTKSRFEAGAVAWAEYNRQPLGRIRQEVTWHNLLPYLPEIRDVQSPPRLLDAGAGSGELALKLAHRGYRVWLLDDAPTMIELAREAAQRLPDDVRQRLHFCPMSAADASAAFVPGFFDAITCHTLIEYLPHPQDTLGALTGLLRNGGLLSLSFVNRYAEVLRQVLSRADPVGALEKLEQRVFCASLFGVSGQAYTTSEVITWLDDPEFLEALIRFESAVADRSPYREIARYSHVLAHKNPRPA
jgi:2-polyprenyl-3-methyl-5-hydroxy-6-metoxy-1,4-benzoquinol methylase